MDVVYNFVAESLGVEKDNIVNQACILYVVLGFGGTLFYLMTAYLSYSYFFVWKRRRFFPSTVNVKLMRKQMMHEMWMGATSIPLIALPMLPAPLLSLRGYSKIYTNVDDYGWLYMIFSFCLFFAFTDCLVYWAHRGLHHPLVYKLIHKPHHTYRYTTPFSSHAFHPMDGFGQGIPYYIAIYLFPIHNWLFLGLFFSVNCWTVSIHDQVDFGGSFLNSTGHHTIHHVDFSYNYGQYTTIWDRIGGTYKPAVKTHDYPSSLYDFVRPEM